MNGQDKIYIPSAHPLTEIQEAVLLANRILERVNADPDDDLAVLARQLLRTREALQGIIEIGKRDLSNPKYDSYFEGAKFILGI